MTLLLPQVESQARILKLQAAMKEAGMDAFLLTKNVDLYYFTGSMQSGYAWVPAEGSATFYVKRSLERARGEAAVRCAEMGSFRELSATIAKDYPELAGPRRISIGAALEALPAQLYLKLGELLSGIQGNLIVDGSAIVRRIRSLKSDWELERIAVAATVVAEALQESLNDLREGISELSWMARVEHEIRVRGHIGLMRLRGYNQEIPTGMVGSGAAAAIPTYFDGPAGGMGLGPAAPQSASRKLIARGEPILIDIGCCIDGYVIDQTRTAVIGELPDDLAEAYSVAERIIRRTEERLRPGVAPEQIYTDALAFASDAGLSAHFMGYGPDQVKFLGHGIGLEIDEWPVLARGFRDPLQAGVVLAVEPKFTFPGRGVVGIENSYAVGETGPHALTRSPEGIIVIP